MTSSFRRHIFRRSVVECVAYGLLLDAVVIGIFAAFHLYFPARFNFEFKIDAAILVLTPPIVITIYQLSQGETIARADFVKDYVSEFFMNKELNDTFYYLVYTYVDAKFAEIDAALVAAGGPEKIGSDPKRIASVFEALQEGRIEGHRYFHPSCYQRSLEEKRLDCLLGYFDVLAYYHQNNLVTMEDIAGSLGYHLNILARREVIKQVRSACKNSFKNETYVARNGHAIPFSCLDKFLENVIRYDQETAIPTGAELE